MKKVQPTALACFALSTMLITGCEYATKEDVDHLISAQSKIEKLNESLKEELQTAGSTIAKLEEEVEKLRNPATSEPTAFSKVTLKFTNWAAAEGVEDEADARMVFKGKLDLAESHWREVYGIEIGKPQPDGPDELVRTLTFPNGIITEGQVDDIVFETLNDLELLGSDKVASEIAAVRTSTVNPITVGERTYTYRSTSGALAPQVMCYTELHYALDDSSHPSSAVHWWHQGDTETKAAVGTGTIMVRVRGKIDKDAGDTCKPDPVVNTVYIMVMTKAKPTADEPRVAHYRRLITTGVRPASDTLEHAPVTVDLPGCPPNGWPLLASDHFEKVLGGKNSCTSGGEGLSG